MVLPQTKYVLIVIIVPCFLTEQGLCMILEAAVENGSTMLDPQLDTILNTLHAQVGHRLK